MLPLLANKDEYIGSGSRLIPLLEVAYLMPIMCGLSPGILTSDSRNRLRTCEMACTVAATNHGRPSNEQRKIRIDSTNRSRW